MIKVNQKWIDASQIGPGILSKEAVEILQSMESYSKVYEYETMAQLEFELALRLQIMEAAVSLYNSGVGFATFQTSKCNEKYWILTERGAFILKPNVLPETGIEDIFRNGKKYAFECATAMVIVFYKAVLESIDRKKFNRLFSGLFLYDWQYDKDLGLDSHEGNDFLPGDCVYFENPDYNPKTPQWQGENAIMLDENLYYGHGIGVTTKEAIIAFLNTKRKENSDRAAFLTSQIVRPNFWYLSRFRSAALRENSEPVCCFSNVIISEVGSKTYFL
ncbi:protein-glutamine gamma-glutamyltransferase [Priestia abyssalis]|uniref:protein-glutamine gamma-glutamyltransferase n=1 Tax=Priestia abyssalis TaxID=1221450 RepID=UPI000995A80F|nr:protein-glutamine gamma-glutamyltransferase [Priestia abyssalis]